MKTLRTPLTAFAVTLACIAAGGCASAPTAQSPDEILDAKLAQEPAVHGRAQLRSEADQLIATAPGLTDDQRRKLAEYRKSSRKEDNDLRSRSLKLQSVLMKDLLSPTQNAREIDLVKTELRKTEHDRVSNLFRAVRATNTILGRWASRNERESEDFYEMMLLEERDMDWGR